MLGLHGKATSSVAALALLAVVSWVRWRRPDVPRVMAVLLGALLLIVTPVQPWYGASLVALAPSPLGGRRRRWLLPGYPTFSLLSSTTAMLSESGGPATVPPSSFGRRPRARHAGWQITTRFKGAQISVAHPVVRVTNLM